MEKVTTKEIVQKYNFKFTKSLGQNFLTDQTVLDDIVIGSEVCEEDFVIEIGPGVGTLTKELLKKAKKVCAVELDSNLIPILQEELKEFNNFQLIHKDALKINFKELIGDEKSVKVVANLPYYVTTPIIARLLKEGYNFKSLTIMIQKEVAERIASEPNCKEYGALSILVQYYCDTTIIRKVPPTCFIPQPKVDSIIIRLDRLNEPRVKVQDKELFFKIVRQSFNMRRKTLRNAIKSLGFISSDKIEKVFNDANIDPRRRGETLTLEEFGKLADSVYKIKEV
ncbi:16S rRNA (adenine(1518)-N(6)/adenine(1519)-N(6))-dimethyltransferase RsmA [Clostridium botulinum]|uniref:Ribosomal RNA small subunit methyltransferase A n=1 Tax=Clostridium botulinum D str. 1873 TaxID=592027 RepID=A0A9P2LM96_CLOBO|nr:MULTISPECIES: 16S rRNA (adenine(1518)-N(6)/adenine(1519)-N(6))-dimethyltransferase RsmA [Clostridium]AYF54055.1 16S rRNA (adenine(1518)-N(6)/adenine(1519)-N(6))-dimethyltransferase RsmA [Clostridium novyi]EES92378.1 dimethyladenosine transferase [Clostridium botulinum D str. 1873]MBO3442676.1 16S rRNA (adenine(1518)-N(6)/adenine(1519)-N(6))-dimethyltransferase RsmA [Clostridium haemolyticum]MCD3216810.1 16S rRNA (adenine(1518)-N(6)/adenine(1519)-N(6))-dimethyltransferase RsmA [Clostridium bo